MDTYYLFASSVAALTARVFTHPIDTIKTRLQVRSTTGHEYQQLKQVILPVEESNRNVFGTLRSLYRGLPVTLLFSVPALSVYLTCYETTKAHLAHRGGLFDRDGILNHLASGCLAEVAAGVLFTPMEVMKNQLQTQGVGSSRSAWSLAQHIWQAEGIKGFFRGYWMGLAVFVPHTMTYFAVYEQCKMAYARHYNYQHQGDSAQLPMGAYLLCSGVASTMGIMLSTPLDIVKTRWQISAAEHGAAFRLGPFDIVRRMWQREGRWRAFTRGLVARIAWGIPTTAISMSVFEAFKDWRANQNS
ncbi:mitochondrial carrier domain-containing protein [Zychaea mexicana]|uniref:mitochondrial carrier domain-containing protein n=1 Tax=Zychaea mexicana TaxID=64656 RepID=UPI0022FEDD08|nr:mitochondrial carrier domain-containing protein [Zychaea mexicana]KAI9498343.1 mitochondrial carrier domain-containing protein [Zychaea mexicana]